MARVDIERVDILDLSSGADTSANAPAPVRPPTRLVPRPLAIGVAVTFVAGILGVNALHAAASRQRDADIHLTVTVDGASPGLQAPAETASRQKAGTVEALVTLSLRVSVPVSVLTAELDGAPPVTRPTSRAAATRNPTTTVKWRVLCAEVGTIPGPRLLDIALRAQSGDQRRRVRLSTTDDDAIARVFRLTAEQDCTS